MATKAQLEAQLAELQAASGKSEKSSTPKNVKIPAWAATSPSEVIGLDTTTGNPYICVARRDGESNAPKIATGGQHAGVGPAKARRFSPDTLAFILDHADDMRKLIDTAAKLKPSA